MYPLTVKRFHRRVSVSIRNTYRTNVVSKSSIYRFVYTQLYDCLKTYTYENTIERNCTNTNAIWEFELRASANPAGLTRPSRSLRGGNRRK